MEGFILVFVEYFLVWLNWSIIIRVRKSKIFVVYILKKKGVLGLMFN